MRSLFQNLRQLSNLCRQFADVLHATRNREPIRSLLRETSEELFAKTARQLDDRQLSDTIGQTLVQGRVAWTLACPQLHAAIGLPGALPAAGSLLGKLLRLAATAEGTDSSGLEPLLSAAESIARKLLTTAPAGGGGQMDFDEFLGAHDPRGRARHGVFFTPRPLAAFVVRETNRILREEFRLERGLADLTTWSQLTACSHPGDPRQDDVPFVRILDPAVGSGVFLREVITCIFAEFHQGHRAGEKIADEWNEYVARHLLPRLHGRDLLLPACAVAWIQIASQLADTGYRFESPTSMEIALADSLLAPTAEPPATVVLGNPPFSALTTSGNHWIDGLLRSASLNGQQVGSYYELDGASLGERKLWLHDDYVKFLRFAQWQIARAGWGIVGFVTNHGYLENLTFRGVRRSLLHSFPRISVLDLHGSRKKRETPPGGGADENVFGIDQGIAIGWLRKSPTDLSSTVTRADLWGSRDQKLAALGAGSRECTWQPVSPTSPNYFLGHSHPQSTEEIRDEYARGFPLDEIMPVHSTAAVTARDSFVIGFTAEEVLERIQSLASDDWTDDELRRRFFHHTRSKRYLPGDTRGWKLATARQRARASGDLRASLRRCLYRPFDWRWVFWAEWMVDWPRTEIMRHMLAGDNLALITRRQMIPSQPANYFFLSDSIVIDGVIRSDNRGSESFFPLFLHQEPERGSGADHQPNFSPQFLFEVSRYAPARELVRPLAIFQLIYAQIHSSRYRDRYQSELCLGFPRVFLPREATLWRQLVDCGKQLIDAHLLRPNLATPEENLLEAGDNNSPSTSDVLTVPRRDWPRYADNSLWINEDCFLRDVAATTWNFQVGGYQVCRKWLRERAGRTLSSEEIGQYRQITKSLAESVRITQEIDEAIRNAGGWPQAFLGRVPESRVQGSGVQVSELAVEAAR